MGVRFSAEILERVAAHVERMKKAKALALTISQSDALRDLVRGRLEAAERAAPAEIA